MEFQLLDHVEEVREAFIERFVMSWDEFQIKQKAWIAQMASNNYTIDKKWYDRALMWDRMNPAFSCVSMTEALNFLREHSGPVFFMGEKGQQSWCRGKPLLADCVAIADASALAARIEQEWYDSYRLAEQNMYQVDAILPEDVYVFDSSMKWCVVFTHETTDWESESVDLMKAAESRVCIICKD